jgi:hypothetical protein
VIQINYSGKFVLKVEPRESCTWEGSSRDHKYDTKVGVTDSDKHTGLLWLSYKINYSGKFALKVKPHQSYTREGSSRDHKHETKVGVTDSDKHTSLLWLRYKINYSGKFALKVEPHRATLGKALAKITNIRLRWVWLTVTN